MRTWGPWAAVVALWFAIACSDGSQNAAGIGGASNNADTSNSAGDGGYCDPKFREKCFDCATAVGVDMACDNGVWNCPPGTTVPAQCPLTPCPNTTEGCCAPGTAIAVQFLCNVSGAQQTICPARSAWGTKAGDACPMPDPCDVDASTDLAGNDCAFPGSTCFFVEPEERYTCGCPQPDAGKPMWQCTSQSSFR